MGLNDEALAVVREEENTLCEVLSRLRDQRDHTKERFIAEEARARELTSQYVATRRDEEKQLIASDEAVSHALKDKGINDLAALDRLVKRPYFARLVVEEAGSKSIEYRIGTVGNSECRIIDWRKAPISKLYFEYKEGEEYSEEIQGRERSGIVRTRNSLEIRGGVLQRITCRLGNFERTPDGWRGSSSDVRFQGRSYDRLPDLLPLITPEQFRTITEEASSAVLIQGIAGSGKTAVALHRLSWLLHEDNSDLTPSEARVIVISPLLKSYIRRTLDAMEFNGVPVLTFSQWVAESLIKIAPQLVSDEQDLRRPQSPMPLAVERVKRSPALLDLIEALQPGDERSPLEILLALLEGPELARHLTESHLLTEEAVQAAAQRTRQSLTNGAVDSCDDALLLRIVQRTRGGVLTKDGTFRKLGHVVVDELQDMGSTEISCALAAVSSLSALTLVGDSSQQIYGSSAFPGWSDLQKRWGKDGPGLHFVSLTVSHRSTLPIMRLADHVQRRTVVTNGRNGKAPIWFHCRTEELGIGAAINWLSTAVERYPTIPTVVLCRDTSSAKEAHRLLAPRFGSVVQLLVPKEFAFEPGIVVGDIGQVKGLEFMNVLVWNPSHASYPNDQLHRNLLYVAISRAEENLCFVTWGKPSAHLPSLDSKLVRGHRVGFDEEEEEE